jgi:type IV secretory pathway VirB9-like protein
MGPSGISPAFLVSEITSPSGQQVEDQDDQRYDQKKMYQAAGDMKAEAQEPENENNYKDCPEHKSPYSAWRASMAGEVPSTPAMHSPLVTNF